MLMEVMAPFVTAQIETADVVVVNKIDQVGAGNGATYHREAPGLLNPRARVIAISAEDGTQVDTLMAELAMIVRR